MTRVTSGQKLPLPSSWLGLGLWWASRYTRQRALALGARTPWYRIRLSRGGGIRAARFSVNSNGGRTTKDTLRPGGIEAKGEVFFIGDLQTFAGQGDRMM